MTRLALVLVALAVGPVAAQTVPLDDALQDFARERGLRLVYSGDLVAGQRTACPARTRASDRPAPAVLACLLGGTGLEARRLPSGTYAVYRTAPSAPAQRPRPTPPAPGARQPVTLSGTVTDAATGEALIGAAVYAPDIGQGTTTNAYGFYSLTIPPGRTRVVASYVGFVPNDVTLDTGADRRRDLALTAAPSGLGEVVVEALDGAPSDAYASVSLSGEDVQSVPAVLGEADVLKALQLQPGVGGGAEGTSGLHVRGGTPDQTLVLLDGIPVYNASHLFGFLSVFNADAVNRVELFKGGFPARYGGRLSSVVDVRMREGNDQEATRHARIGLLSSQALAEGPIGDGRGSYLVAGRRTYIDLLAAPVFKATGGIDGLTPTAYFYDLNAKANTRVGDRDRLYLSLYAGRDRFAASSTDSDGSLASPEGKGKGELAWGNLTGALRWTRPISDRLFSATTLTASAYGFNVGLDSRRVLPGETVAQTFRSRYVSGIRDLALQSDLQWSASPAHSVTVGGSVVRHRYAPGAFTYDPFDTEVETSLGADPVRSWEGALYVEDAVRLGPADLSLGLRATGLAVGGATYGALEPRLAARVGVGGVDVRGSLARMTQYLHLLTTVGGIGLPADLWVPATARVGPERAWHLSAGVAGEAGRTRWSLDGYLKTMGGLVAYRDNATARADTDWQDLVTRGEGRSVGLEALVEHAGPRTSVQLAYTLAKTDRQFDALNGGERFPYRYDRTHDLGLSVRHRLSRRLDLSAAFLYQTGQAITLPTVTFFAPFPSTDLSYDVLPSSGAGSGQTFVYGPRNGFRLPAAHRLDVALDVYFRRGPRPHALSFSVYNVYNRSNPYYVDFSRETDPETGEEQTVLRGRGLLPILPSVSYQFSF